MEEYKNIAAMNGKFEWVQRYGEDDKFGRWGLLCYYNGMLIAWISYVTPMIHSQYHVKDYFPSLHLANPLFACVYKELDTAKGGVEIRFMEFFNIINQE